MNFIFKNLSDKQATLKNIKNQTRLDLFKKFLEFKVCKTYISNSSNKSSNSQNIFMTVA